MLSKLCALFLLSVCPLSVFAQELGRHDRYSDAERNFANFDPRPVLAKVKSPVLALNGEKDLQVPYRENLVMASQVLETISEWVAKHIR